MKILLAALASIFIISCKSNPETGDTKISTETDTTQFFQVSEFIENQIADINKTPYFIYKKVIENTNTDSVNIDNIEFKRIALQFAQPDINNPSIKKSYTESVFFDQTTKTYTLNYTAKDKSLEIQSIDVLLKEDAETVKRIFIRKFFNYNNDSTAIEQLSWKPDEEFQIARIVQNPGKQEKTRQTIIVWNK